MFCVAGGSVLLALNVAKLKTERTSAHTFEWNALRITQRAAKVRVSNSFCLSFAEDKLFIDWNSRQWISEKRYFRSSPILTFGWLPEAFRLQTINSIFARASWKSKFVDADLRKVFAFPGRKECLNESSDAENLRWKFGMGLISDFIVGFCVGPAAVVNLRVKLNN